MEIFPQLGAIEIHLNKIAYASYTINSHQLYFKNSFTVLKLNWTLSSIFWNDTWYFYNILMKGKKLNILKSFHSYSSYNVIILFYKGHVN